MFQGLMWGGERRAGSSWLPVVLRQAFRRAEGPMRFLPLVWAALRRKPVRSILGFLSVTVAFTLFGLMIGLNATLEVVLSRAHADRVWVGTRFDTAAFPIAVGKRVAGLPGVRDSPVMNYVPG